MPPTDLKLSVFVVDTLDADGIHQDGRQHAQREGKPPKAFGAIAAAVVLKQKLTIDPNDDRDDNPPLHADILGWPATTDEKKSEWKSIAQQLAEKATLYISP